MPTPSSPQISLISPAVSVAWSDGTPFTGYYLFMLRYPSSGGVAWTEFTLNTNVQRLIIPGNTLLPIVDGIPNGSVGLFYNADISPPTTQYLAYIYDGTKRQLAGPSAGFTVSAATFTPPVLAITAPNAYGTNPTPDS